MPSVANPSGVTTGVGVLDRTAAVLEAVEQGHRTFTQIARKTGFSRSTTHRLINALCDHEWLLFLGPQGYVLGPRLLRLANTALRDLPLKELARPALERLAAATGESAQLFVRSGGWRVCVDSVPSGSELRAIVEIGASLPLTAGSAGKLFLAWTSKEERERLIAGAKPLTERTPTGERLAREVAAARRRGWAFSSGEREPGVASISAPVLAGDQIIAAVSLAGPAGRLKRFEAERSSRSVRIAAGEIERTLSGPGS